MKSPFLNLRWAWLLFLVSLATAYAANPLALLTSAERETVTGLFSRLKLSSGRDVALNTLRNGLIPETGVQLLSIGPNSAFHPGAHSTTLYGITARNLVVVKTHTADFLEWKTQNDPFEYFKMHLGYGLAGNWRIGARYYGAMRGNPGTIVINALPGDFVQVSGHHLNQTTWSDLERHLRVLEGNGIVTDFDEQMLVAPPSAIRPGSLGFIDLDHLVAAIGRPPSRDAVDGPHGYFGAYNGIRRTFFEAAVQSKNRSFVAGYLEYLRVHNPIAFEGLEHFARKIR